VTKMMSPYDDFAEVGRNAGKVELRAGAQGDGSAARVVALGQDYPLAPPPPVQFVLCFEEAPLDSPGVPSNGAFLIGFREEDGRVQLIPATIQDVINGLRKLQSVLKTVRNVHPLRQ